MSKLLKNWKQPRTTSKPQKGKAKAKTTEPVKLDIAYPNELPKREDLLKKLKCEKFDVVIIGGGATGAGCALDAVTRGLKTALIERDDFACGTSSKSTKLVHGGLRYLQEAILKFDSKQIKLVIEALHERKHLLSIAPHLTKVVPIIVPLYSLIQLPQMFFGLKMYDLISGMEGLRRSYLMGKKRTLDCLPTLKEKGLLGSMMFYDGQMNDTRLNVALALTAIRRGAVVLNHIAACKILKREREGDDDCEPITVNGICARDQICGDDFKITTKCVINASGPHTDCVRKMDDRCVENLCTLSSGVHIVLPGCLCPHGCGMLKPSSDGRVMFMLPWKCHTIVGTTEECSELTFAPRAKQENVETLMCDLKNGLHPDVNLSIKDILSSWSGIRPLVNDPSKTETKSMSRGHIVDVSDSNLITITGGKWTTYRVMAKDAVDAAIEVCCLKPKLAKSQTKNLLLEGANMWSPTMHFQLMDKYCFECDTAKHLSETYGDRAFLVAELALCGEVTKCGGKIYPKKLHPKFPYLEAEVTYVLKEYAQTPSDVLARRINLAFLNVVAAFEVLPKVTDIMAKELNWDDDLKKKHYACGVRYLCKQMRYIKKDNPISA